MMLEAIAIAEAVGATVAMAILAQRCISWRRKATIATAKASELDDECIRLSAHVTRLSAQLDVQRSKPGPQKRARERAMIAARTAELVREIAA